MILPPNTPEKKRIEYELEYYSKSFNFIAGIDEVGRGPLAGPLVIASVVFKKENVLAFAKNKDYPKAFIEIRDSKRISEKKRERLAEFIKDNALDYSIQIIENTILDEMGISKSTQMGFHNSLKALGTNWDFALTDNFQIKAIPQYKQLNLVKGDDRSISIGAASIIAKVHRDNVMKAMALKYPEYGFERHKGYGTKAHMEALKKMGPCEIHRRSFEPIKSILTAI